MRKYVLSVMLATLACNWGWAAAAEPPAGGGVNALSGPKVKVGATKNTLVERDFDGKLRRLEISPEEAAIPLLKLDDATKTKVESVVAARSLLLDVFVRENLDLLLRFSTANATNDKQEQGVLLSEAFSKAAPIREHGRLLETVGAVLSEGERKKFNALVQEYRKAQVEEETEAAGMGEKGKRKPEKGSAMLKIGLEQFGQDVKRAYERVIAEGQGKVEEVVGRLELTQAQEEKVRKLISNFAQAHIKTPPTANEKTKLFLDISAELNPTQRGKLLKYVQENK